MTGSRATRGWSSWVTRTTLVGSIGACAGAFVWGPAHLVGTSIPVSLLVAVAHFVFRGDHEEALRGWRLWRSVVRVSLCATALLMSVSVAATLSSALGLLVFLVLVVTTPPVRSTLLRVRQTAHPVPMELPAPAARLRALSDAELCEEWHRSSRALDRTRDVRARAALVTTRQLLLDEVWTRHRHELETWVARGARAHDGTHRFYDAP